MISRLALAIILAALAGPALAQTVYILHLAPDGMIVLQPMPGNAPLYPPSAPAPTPYQDYETRPPIPAGERVMASVSRFLTNKLQLKVNETKSAVARPEERKFLGFSISNDGLETQMPPTSAICWSRAAMLTASPYRSSPSMMISPT
jgi:hypothetical protein